MPDVDVVTGAFGYTGRYITGRLLEPGRSVKTLTGHPNRPNPCGDPDRRRMLDLLFAATYPARTMALVIHGSYPSARWEPDAPWGWRSDEFADRLLDIERSWGTEDFVRREFPSIADDAQLVRWLATYMRRGASPGAAVSADRMEYDTDVRDILPAIHVPTLILHRVEDDPEANRYMAEHISGAEYVALPGNEHIPYLGDQDSVLKEIERFVRGVKAEEASLDRVLATVLFTDIVGSTEKAAEL